jgi:zinc transport system substrate-binding protein
LANAASGKALLDQLKSDVDVILAPVRNRNFIVFHDAYQYFETAFDFPASGAISISDASEPSPARIQQIHDRVKDAGVTCVLAEPQFNPDLVATVLDGSEARSGTIDPLGSHIKTGPKLYTKLVRDLAQTLADCV